MKKFKYNLEPVLKLRKFKEEKARRELGFINQKIQALKQRIQTMNDSIDSSYQQLSSLTNQKVKADSIQFFPFYIDDLRKSIRVLEKEVKALDVEYKLKSDEVYKLRGEKKILENHKHKEQASFKKKLEIKTNIDLQDEFLISQGTKEDNL